MNRMIRIVLMIVFVGTISFSLAQSNVIAETIYKADHYYIPQAALADSVEAIVYHDMFFKKVKAGKRPVSIRWNSACNDGYYHLTITPEQIFLYSSHDNPNPGFLYWVINIDSLQFRQITKGFEKKKPEGFIKLSQKVSPSITKYFDSRYTDTFPIPEVWTDELQNENDNFCDSKMKAQLQKLSTIINSYLTNKTGIPNTREIEKIKTKYFSCSKEVILDVLPIKIDQVDTKELR